MRQFTKENLQLLEMLGFERKQDDNFLKKISEKESVSAVPYTRGDIWFQVRIEPEHIWFKDSDFYARDITTFLGGLYSIAFNRGITVKEDEILKALKIHRDPFLP